MDWLASTLVVIFFVGWHDYASQGGPEQFYVLIAYVVESAALTALAGGSFGKLATRLRTVRVDGDPRPVDLLRALARQIMVAVVIPPLVFRPDGRGLYDVIIAAFGEAGFSPHVGQEAPRIVSTLNLVAAGLGITIVPASLSRLPLEGVSYRPLTGRPAIKVPLSLACRSDERSAATLGFIDLVRRLS